MEACNDFRLHRKLVPCKSQCIACSISRKTIHLEEDGPRPYNGRVVFRSTLPRTHRHFRSFSCHRSMRKNAHPYLATPLYTSGHRTARRFDLACSDLPSCHRLETDGSKGECGTALCRPSLEGCTLTMSLAVFGFLGLEHRRLRSKIGRVNITHLLENHPLVDPHLNSNCPELRDGMTSCKVHIRTEILEGDIAFLEELTPCNLRTIEPARD